jgi:hypothetical protein
MLIKTVPKYLNVLEWGKCLRDDIMVGIVEYWNYNWRQSVCEPFFFYIHATNKVV